MIKNLLLLPVPEEDKKARQYMANESSEFYEQSTTDNSMRLFYRIRIDATLLRAYGCQLAAWVSCLNDNTQECMRKINESADKIQFSTQICMSEDNRTDDLNIVYENGEFKMISEDSTIEDIVSILNEIVQFISDNFKSYIIDFENSILNEQLNYGKSSHKRNTITRGTALDI